MMSRMLGTMKQKVSATLSPDRLERARRITGTTNISALLDEALSALIERESEQQWLDAHAAAPEFGEFELDLSSIPWEPD
jgi:post-segregation antitoxin (ccd killing protein)